MKNILITGGTGFIGYNLCKALYENNKIYCVDNFSTSPKININLIKKIKNVELINQDIESPLQLKSIDEIYNLACPASPKKYIKHPIKTLTTCINGAINTLELAKQNHAKIMQASTSEIYGNPLEHPQTENYYGNVNPTGKRSCYNEGKRAAETIFFDYKREYKLDIKIARIFNTYGPFMCQTDGRVISSFINAALNNKPLIIHGKGNQTRSFCFIDDLIEGLIKIMQYKHNLDKPINIGNTEEITITKLAKTIIKLTNSNSTIMYKKENEDEPKKRNPDINLMTSLTNWTPKTTLTDGLNKTIKFYTTLLKKQI